MQSNHSSLPGLKARQLASRDISAFRAAFHHQAGPFFCRASPAPPSTGGGLTAAPQKTQAGAAARQRPQAAAGIKIEALVFLYVFI